MMLKYYDEAGADGAESGGAGGEPVKTYTEDEVAGLKAKLDELLKEKKSASQKAKDAEAARIAAEQEAAKKSGELDKFEQSLRSGFEKERGELTGKLEALTTRVLGESKKAILGAFTGDFIAPESVDLVAQLVKTEFDGADVKTQFTDFAGNVITTDPAEFRKWMAKHPAISHLMKADAANGGGAAGSKSSGGATNFAQMTLTQKAQLANENPKLYAQLSGQSQ